MLKFLLCSFLLISNKLIIIIYRIVVIAIKKFLDGKCNWLFLNDFTYWLVQLPNISVFVEIKADAILVLLIIEIHRAVIHKTINIILCIRKRKRKRELSQCIMAYHRVIK